MTDSREEPLNNSLTKSEPVEDTTAKDDGEIHSGVGVLDKTVKILDALESGPSTLGQLVAATGLARPTAHRLAIALERHRFVLRDQHGRFVLGSRFAELAAAAGEDRLLTRPPARSCRPCSIALASLRSLPPPRRSARVHRRCGTHLRPT